LKGAVPTDMTEKATFRPCVVVWLEGWVAIPAGTYTVSAATALVTEPAAFVTTTKQQHLEILLDLNLLGLELRDFQFRHGLQVGVRLPQHGASLGQAVFHLLPFAVFGHDQRKFALRLGDLAVLI